MIRAGRLRHNIVIQQPTEGATGDYGERSTTWGTYYKTHAEIVPQTSREFERARMLQETMTHLVRIRYTSGVTAAMRVLHDGRYLYLTGPPIDPDERHIELLLTCAEQV
ncbi:MAG: phage head closure protein [Planctomycetes bacterium]|nr:phage head closure protein [Planctomycetota bacterium]